MCNKIDVGWDGGFEILTPPLPSLASIDGSFLAEERKERDDRPADSRWSAEKVVLVRLTGSRLDRSYYK